jgi:hypothetical protein
MPQTIKQSEFSFLVDLNAWVARGFAQGGYAEEIGVSEGTITYRLKEHRLVSRRGVGLVDRETGETFEQRVGRDFYRLAAAETQDAVAV